MSDPEIRAYIDYLEKAQEKEAEETKVLGCTNLLMRTLNAGQMIPVGGYLISQHPHLYDKLLMSAAGIYLSKLMVKSKKVKLFAGLVSLVSFYVADQWPRHSLGVSLAQHGQLAGVLTGQPLAMFPSLNYFKWLENDGEKVYEATSTALKQAQNVIFKPTHPFPEEAEIRGYAESVYAENPDGTWNH